VEDKEIREIFCNIRKKNYYKAQDAITMIKNIDLSMYYIPFERTDYQARSGETQLHLARFLKTKGGLNYNLTIALFLDQILIESNDTSKKYYSFQKTTRRELIEKLVDRFEALAGKDKILASEWRNEFDNLLKSDKRFHAIVR